MRHYFTNDDTLKSHLKKHLIVVEDKHFTLQTDHGVFSKQGLDFGSRLLIETLIHKPFSKVLDLGCGYGPIGIILKAFNPNAEIDMVDVNERAIELAKENAKLNKQAVRVFLSDGLNQVKDQYDFIVTNPPIRAGKSVIYRFFEDAKEHLTENGSLYIVIQKKQGAPSAFTFCQTIYPKVAIVEKKSGYQIIKCGI